MATNYQTGGWVRLDGVSYTGGQGNSGSTLSWTGINTHSDVDYNIVDDDDDGRLDVGGDSYYLPSAYFSGYTISVGGVEYPVFDGRGGLYVALPVDGSTQAIIPTSGTSNIYQSETSDSGVFLCFAEGSQIATPQGEVAVETLKIGDLVLTDQCDATPVRWIGRQTVHKLSSGPHMQPVRIRAGALGNGLPHSNLTVTADHGMVIDGLVINASALVNGTTIDFVPMAELPERVTYYHIETEAHDVILANGAPAETFMDAAGRAAFDNHQEYLDLYGAERIIPEMSRPRINAQRLLPDAIKARLGIGNRQISLDAPLSA